MRSVVVECAVYAFVALDWTSWKFEVGVTFPSESSGLLLKTRFFAFHQCCWTQRQCGHAYSSIHMCVVVVGHCAEGKLASCCP